MENSFSNELSVLSLNCWGLYIVAKKREFRLHSIADRLSEEDYDIVALQEVWVLEDFDYIKETVSHKLPYSKYFYSGTMGSGLAILSRYPILSSSYLKFTLAGRPLKIFQGDFYVGKGCGCVCIDHPDIGLLDVYTTHLQAEYGDVIEYEAQRITECWQIANSVRTSAAQGRHVILAGDFNSVPASCCYKILTEHGFMVDTWLEVKKDGLEDDFRLLHSNDLAPSECIQRFGITCDSPVNTWSKHFLKQHPYNHNIGDRLDYIYYRRTPHMTCLQSRVVMVDLIPNTAMSYSDHFGVHSIFNIKS
ncbi:Endonuclease/exonuclease/phosphatase, partial [Pilobolus umbonatus]